jgi:hypothetical protein
MSILLPPSFKGLSLCWLVGVCATVDRRKLYNQSIAQNADCVKFECLYVINRTITLSHHSLYQWTLTLQQM